MTPENERLDIESEAEGNPSHDADTVPFFSETGPMAEMEAIAIQGILEANEIPSVMTGTSTLPVVEFVVSVPQNRLAEAGQAIDDAKAAGPAAAEQGALESQALGVHPDED